MLFTGQLYGSRRSRIRHPPTCARSCRRPCSAVRLGRRHVGRQPAPFVAHGRARCLNTASPNAACPISAIRISALSIVRAAVQPATRSIGGGRHCNRRSRRRPRIRQVGSCPAQSVRTSLVSACHEVRERCPRSRTADTTRDSFFGGHPTPRVGPCAEPRSTPGSLAQEIQQVRLNVHRAVEDGSYEDIIPFNPIEDAKWRDKPTPAHRAASGLR